MPDRKVVLVTRRSRLDELIARFQTIEQAKFYIEHLGADFTDYERERTTYLAARASVEQSVLRHCRVQVLDRSFLPNYLFAPDDIVIALGQDGLVANTMKYLQGQPLIGVNPDLKRYDGILLPFSPADISKLIGEVLAGARRRQGVTMAKAALSDGQSLYAVNDFFIGPKSHTSAHYEIAADGRKEIQSSSGIIVSTGLGSTAWMKSVLTGARAIAHSLGVEIPPASQDRVPWDAPYLNFAVREPFPSVATQATLVCGRLSAESPLKLLSLMAEKGVIFSDGMEADFLEFNSGMTATVGVADKQGYLVI